MALQRFLPEKKNCGRYKNMKYKELSACRLFLLDMDGTIYMGNKLLDGTCDFLNYIKSIGGKYLFMTNNSSKRVDKYIEKLASMGICAMEEDFVTSVHVTIKYLKEKDYKKIYVFGTKALKSQLREARLPITDVLENDIDCLCIGYDTELTFQKLEHACILLGRGVDYIATNTDWVCPTEYGYVPDCGSISKILCEATGRMPEFMGKPKPDMAHLAMELCGFGKDETVLIGDRIYTDIACGVNAGIKTVLVLSGETTREDLEESRVKPDFVFDNIKKMHNLLLQCEKH